MKQRTITILGTLLIAAIAGFALNAGPMAEDSDKKKAPAKKTQPAPKKPAHDKKTDNPKSKGG